MIARMILTTLLAALALGAQTTASGPKRLWKWSVAALAAGNLADGMTSVGHYELNPVLGNGRFGTRSVGVKIGMSSALVGAQYLMLRRRPEGARKAAFINFAMGGLTGGMAIRNSRLK